MAIAQSRHWPPADDCRFGAMAKRRRRPSAASDYSPLADIRKDNVAQLKPAWIYHSGDFSKGNATHGGTALQVTPLMVDGTLYFCTPYNRIVALDAESGREKWKFDSHARLDAVYTPVCRGVAYWQDARPPKAPLPGAHLHEHGGCRPLVRRRRDRPALQGLRQGRSGGPAAGPGRGAAGGVLPHLRATGNRRYGRQRRLRQGRAKAARARRRRPRIRYPQRRAQVGVRSGAAGHARGDCGRGQARCDCDPRNTQRLGADVRGPRERPHLRADRQSFAGPLCRQGTRPDGLLRQLDRGAGCRFRHGPLAFPDGAS